MNIRGEDGKESYTNQADKSGGAGLPIVIMPEHLPSTARLVRAWLQRTPGSIQDQQHVGDDVKDQSGIKETKE